jgi:hypothetical protein
MYNLLSRKDKKYVQKEYRYRVVTLSFAIVSGSMIFGIVLLLPAYFFVQSQKEALSDKQAYAQSLEEQEEEGISSAQLFEIKEKIDVLSHDAERKSAVEVLSKVIYERNDGILINGISYQKNVGDGARTIEVRAVGKDREALVKYQDFLEGLGIFDSIDLPISNFVASEDIPFTITMVAFD